jgi:hypothetical protein
MKMNRLTLLLAWLAPLWFIVREWKNGTRKMRLHHKAGSGQWSVAFGKHHYSTAPSLRTALVAALRKVKPAQQENPPHE